MKKRLLLLAAAALICLCLSACGAGRNPDIGEYECVARSSYGYDIGSDGSSVLLEGLFRGRIKVADADCFLLWFSKEGSLTVLADGEKYFGTVGDGVLTLELAGVSYTFAKPGTDIAAESAEPTELQALWNGSWYGYWNVKDATGAWAANDAMTYRCQALVELDEYGQGVITMWDEDGSEELPMAEVSISASADGSSAVSSEGYFWMADVTGNEWRLRLYEEDIPQLIMLGEHYNSDEGSFRYEILLSRKQPEQQK